MGLELHHATRHTYIHTKIYIYIYIYIFIFIYIGVGMQLQTQQSVDSKIVPVSSIAPDGWCPKEGGNATSLLHSRGSPTKGTKSEVKTYAGGHPDAPRNKAWIQRLSRFPQ